LRRPIFWIIVLEVVLVGWFAVHVAQVYLQLRAARADATAIESAVINQQTDAALARVGSLQHHAARAAAGSSGPLWHALEHLPFLGDDVRMVETVSSVVNEISADAIPSAVAASRDVDAHGLLDGTGRIDLAAIARIAPRLATAHRAFDKATSQLDAVDTRGIAGPVRSAFDNVTTTVTQLNGILTSADTALAVIPSMAGEQGTRHYLLALENNAEMRASGGLPGVLVELTAARGRVTLGPPISTSGAFKKLPRPILALSPVERALYGDNFGQYMMDANFTPDFPRTAALMAARWEHEGGDRLDGVLMIDTVSLSYLLKATGPVTVDGIELNADNAVAELLSRTYQRLAGNQKAQDAFFQKVTAAVFTKLTSGSANPSALVSALGRSASEGRVRVRSFHADETRRIGDTAVAGILSADPRTTQLGVFVDDATLAKMNIFLDYNLGVRSRSCSAGRATLAMDMALASSAPQDMSKIDWYITGGGAYAPVGSQSLVVYLYAPYAGTISNIKVDGKPANLETYLHLGRDVAAVHLILGPGAAGHLTWTATTGPQQRGKVRVEVTPTAVPGDKTLELPAAC
jgi:hypothetical protein